MAYDHHCHALGCRNKCPPKHLMCMSCWQKVPPTLQQEVWNTYDLRADTIDGSWAPWWRAQAKAIGHVAFPNDSAMRERFIAKEMKFAATLESKQKAKEQSGKD